ncbi:MAG: ATP-binding cassette domain-containing protein [Anaerolineae bacterium]|nr:ATP-binding cassette domain-containing protein [Anaerolineae bacterium]
MIKVENLVKHYANVKAVDGVSFSVGEGEIFGLLGPNGAGKTTTIRTIMDIIKPDSGAVRLMGQPMTEASKARIGYLPEERGLYKSFRLLECLTYLGALKGMPRREASQRAVALLEQAGLGEYARRKVQELSKGMTQKAQFLAALVHDPALLILDEPFQGLDPINTDMLKNILLAEQARGKTIILSTHDMNQVEEMCDRILLINRGRVVLYGQLADIKAEYAKHEVLIECDRLPDTLDGAQEVRQRNHTYEILLSPHGAPQSILRQVVDAGIAVRRFEVARAPLEEIFVQVVEATQ